MFKMFDKPQKDPNSHNFILYSEDKDLIMRKFGFEVYDYIMKNSDRAAHTIYVNPKHPEHADILNAINAVTSTHKLMR